MKNRVPAVVAALLVISAAAAAFAAGPSGKLPGGVTSRIKKIDTELSKAVSVLEKEGVASTQWRVETASGHLKAAKELLAEIEKGYGAQIGTGAPEMTAVMRRINETEDKVAGLGKARSDSDNQKLQAQERQDSTSAAWIERFKPYADFYGEKRLLTSVESTPSRLKGQEVFYKEAKTLFEEYKGASFPDGKTEELSELERRFSQAIEAFPSIYKESVEKVCEEPMRKIQEAQTVMKERLAASTPQVPQNNEFIAYINRAVKDVSDVLPAGSEKVKELSSMAAQIERENAELKKRWIANTFIRKDAYKGPDASALKETAGKIVKKEYPDASLAKLSIVSEDWKEERVHEWTDTTRTAVRYRVTRSVTAQVSARRGTEAFLYTLDLSQDKTDSGAWGSTYGHIMFIDPMLGENVSKTADS